MYSKLGILSKIIFWILSLMMFVYWLTIIGVGIYIFHNYVEYYGFNKGMTLNCNSDECKYLIRFILSLIGINENNIDSGLGIIFSFIYVMGTLFLTEALIKIINSNFKGLITRYDMNREDATSGKLFNLTMVSIVLSQIFDLFISGFDSYFFIENVILIAMISKLKSDISNLNIKGVFDGK